MVKFLMIFMVSFSQPKKENMWGFSVMNNILYTGIGGKNFKLQVKVPKVVLEIEFCDVYYRLNKYDIFSPQAGFEGLFIKPGVRFFGLKGGYISFGIPFVKGKNYSETNVIEEMNIFPAFSLDFGYRITNFTGISFEIGVGCIIGTINRTQVFPDVKEYQPSPFILPSLTFLVGYTFLPSDFQKLMEKLNKFRSN